MAGTSRNCGKMNFSRIVAEMLEKRQMLSGGLNRSWGVGGIVTPSMLYPAASIIPPPSRELNHAALL